MEQGLLWKLRRVAAGLRQQDVAVQVGVSTTRYSAFERGEALPSDTDVELIEKVLPPLPTGLKTIEHKRETQLAQPVSG